MTMRLTIKNEDEDRSRVLAVEVVDEGHRSGHVVSTERLKPGEQREFWVHSGRHLTVSELPVETNVA